MLREHLFNKTLITDPDFRWRGGEVSRLEAFSDGIFAITITLLIVATAGVERFYDVWLLVRDLPAFFFSFVLIMYVWFEHHQFFRRYGLSDGLTLLTNSLLMFLVMILAYPLKLLTTFLWHLILGEPTLPLFKIPADATVDISLFQQRIYMMYFYGAAIIGVFGCILLLHLNAWRQRQALELDALERFITLQSISHQVITVLIAALSLTILFTTKRPDFAGIVYFLMPAAHIPLGIIMGRRRSKLNE